MTVRIFHMTALLMAVAFVGCGADPEGAGVPPDSNLPSGNPVGWQDAAPDTTTPDATTDRSQPGDVDDVPDTIAVDVSDDAPADTFEDARTDGSLDTTPQRDVSPIDAVSAGDAAVDDVDVRVAHDAPDAGVDVVDVRDDGVDVLDVPDVRDTAVDLVDVLDVPDVRDAGVDVLDVPDVRDAGVDVVDVPDVREAAVDVVDVPDARDAAVDVVDVPDARDAAVDVVDVIDVPDVRDTAVDAVDVVDVPDVRDVTDVGMDTTVTPDVPADVLADVVIPPDPVMYTGTLPIRTDGAVFMTRFQVLGNNRDVWVLMPRVLPRNAPLVLGYHGTNSDGAVFLSESGAAAVSDAQGVVFIAPSSRWFSETGADFDHPGGNGTYWETANNTNPNTNEDLVLTRAIIQEARRVYGIDPTRVYAYGHSNGGFMAYMVSQVLRDRVVGFGENAAGLSRCNPQQSCRFQGSGTTCAALATQSGWCACAGAELPIAVSATGRRTPGVLFHGTADPLVSVFHTCMLESRMRAVGNPVQTTLFDGGGHSDFSAFASRMWSYLSVYRLP